MQVNSYIFQSPYSSQVQIGRPDPSVKEEENTKETKNTQQESNRKATKIPNESLQDANSFASTIIKEVTPSISNNSLDIYA